MHQQITDSHKSSSDQSHFCLISLIRRRMYNYCSEYTCAVGAANSRITHVVTVLTCCDACIGHSAVPAY